MEQDFLRLKAEVRKEFGYFHGVLQAREQALLEDLDTAHSNTMEPLLNCRFLLNNVLSDQILRRLANIASVFVCYWDVKFFPVQCLFAPKAQKGITKG